MTSFTLLLSLLTAISFAAPVPPQNGSPCKAKTDCPSDSTCWFYKLSDNASAGVLGICRPAAHYKYYCGGDASTDPLSASLPKVKSADNPSSLIRGVCDVGFKCIAIPENAVNYSQGVYGNCL
ncbi:hypothetical protein HDU99_002348 [Rhizoclosmatium hyalinum]|nr:hypothetical protein HDU99_002348 [Rhizoclosmatium hyalinum]